MIVSNEKLKEALKSFMPYQSNLLRYRNQDPFFKNYQSEEHINTSNSISHIKIKSCDFDKKMNSNKEAETDKIFQFPAIKKIQRNTSIKVQHKNKAVQTLPPIDYFSTPIKQRLDMSDSKRSLMTKDYESAKTERINRTFKKLHNSSRANEKLNHLKHEINFQKVYLSFNNLKTQITGTNSSSSVRIIKQFLFLNQILDTSVFSMRNFDNLINFLKGDFKKKISKRKSLRENLIDILKGSVK